jgi:Kef-type K+ transport system membrane component KefB
MVAVGLQSRDLQYVALLFALFVLPKVLLRWRIPSAITSLALGVAAGPVAGLFHEDGTVGLLSTLGIVALFLLAGLHVNVTELRREGRVLLGHVGFQLATLVLVGLAAARTFGLEGRSALLAALAIVTPSGGFILDSLGSLPVTEKQRFWIRSKAIATELVALAVLFITLQSTTAARLSLSTLILVSLIFVLPLAFRLFASVILPFAPRSEFAFLVMVAVLCAFATRELGVYYLVGAFVVGLTAQRFRLRLPAMTSDKMLHALEAFASLFIPFYFFHAGLELRSGDLTGRSLSVGGILLAVGLPLRIAVVALHRRLTFRESLRDSLPVSLPLLPTLVFTLVIAGILRERFQAPDSLVGGLVVYAVLNTLLPGLVLRQPAPEFGAIPDTADPRGVGRLP